jgi:hypothetical protein
MPFRERVGIKELLVVGPSERCIFSVESVESAFIDPNRAVTYT